MSKYVWYSAIIVIAARIAVYVPHPIARYGGLGVLGYLSGSMGRDAHDMRKKEQQRQEQKHGKRRKDTLEVLP
jgi:hypothetical protein